MKFSLLWKLVYNNVIFKAVSVCWVRSSCSEGNTSTLWSLYISFRPRPALRLYRVLLRQLLLHGPRAGPALTLNILFEFGLRMVCSRCLIWIILIQVNVLSVNTHYIYIIVIIDLGNICCVDLKIINFYINTLFQISSSMSHLKYIIISIKQNL